jgi:hypothetical protein
MELKPIKMRCSAHMRCTDLTCKHKEEHEHNEGCLYYCHFSDFQLLCKPVSKGGQYTLDTIRLNWKTWLGLRESR